MIASYRPGHELTLVRNPRFHEWSNAAQPGGYADAIVWKLGVRLDDALTAIQRGHADWVLNYGPLPPNRRRQIMTQYASQAHTERVPATYYYFMNTRVPPFNDVRVRRALNYALDRTALARIYHASPHVYRDIIDQAPWLPTVTPTRTDFVSKRVGNYQFHPLWGILVDQLWVR